MLSEKISYLLKLTGANNRKIGEYAGLSDSAISKLRTGVQTPFRDSVTIRKFAAAVIAFAEDNGKIGLLKEQIASSTADELIDWLYLEDAREGNKFSSKVEKRFAFGKKLISLMELAEITNLELSRLVGVDPAYISRYRNGKHFPQQASKVVIDMCRIIADRIADIGKTAELYTLLEIGADVPSDVDIPLVIRDWLYDNERKSSVFAVRRFIDNMSFSPQTAGIKLPDIKEIVTPKVLEDTAESYHGILGIRKAVIRFLSTVQTGGCKELWLYSDLDMNWMSGDFTLKWLSLMSACISSGVKIKIIHNVERSGSELLSAVDDWLPLYMSGMIEPYYCTNRCGDRFTYTLFLAPGHSCIESFAIRKMSNSSEFRYITDSENLKVCEKRFHSLLSDSLPLLKYEKGIVFAEGSFSLYHLGQTQICLSTEKVIVNKLNEPTASFTITNPMLIRAFFRYIDEVKKGENV